MNYFYYFVIYFKSKWEKKVALCMVMETRQTQIFKPGSHERRKEQKHFRCRLLLICMFLCHRENGLSQT